MLSSALNRFSTIFDTGASPPAATSAPGKSSAEQRIAPRHEVVINGRLCVAGVELDCIVRNISTTGMTVAAPGVQACVGMQLVATCDRLGALYGTVRWVRDGALGVQFSAPIPLETMYNARGAAPEGMQPRPGRARVRLPAIAHFGALHRAVEVGNISVGGLMMTARLPLRPAQGLMIEFPEMRPIGGHVRWSEGGRCGVMFTRLLPIAAAEEIARRACLYDAWLEEVRLAHRETAAS